MAGKTLLTTLGLLAVALSGCTTQSPDATVGDDVLSQLKALYVDTPFRGGQDTPAHLFLDQGDGRFLFLHFNDPDVEAATGLAFVGDAFRARGCVGPGGISQDLIDDGYVHFHKETSAQWDAGHHTTTNPGTMGYWFRHVAAAPGVDPMGVGAVGQGEVYPLMPSYENAPACA